MARAESGGPPRRDEVRPIRSGISVRARITATVALLVTAALSGVGAIVWGIESNRVEAQAAERADLTFRELEQFQANTATDRRLRDVGRLLDGFLANEVPDDFQTFVTWYDGDVQATSAAPGIDASTREFRDAAAEVAVDNGRTTVVQSGDELILDAQTVERRGDVGALIVVTYLTESRAGLLETMRTYAIAALLSLMVISGLAWTQAGRLLAPLRTLRETAEEVSDSDLSRRLPVRGHDDITALTITVNGMLDRLEAAFVGQRQFLDDAGHELKTPLTVLRGHLELLDVGSPAEIEETRALLLDELDRMARLVEELILLAKSDRPDFVRTRRVDVTDLTVDVLAKARALGERRWTMDGAASLVAELDEQRVTQALLQMCDNAVKHTEAGDQIAIGSAYDDGDLRLWVRDVGPGVPTADRELIFDRFGRSRVPEDDEGFGLGLSIVRAIAAAHGGRVEVTDAAPRGALFTLHLPVGDDALADDPTPTSTEEEAPLWHGS